MALAKLKSMGLPRTSLKLAKKMKEHKQSSFKLPNVKMPKDLKAKNYNLGKITKTVKLPKAKKLAMLKAKLKNVRK